MCLPFSLARTDGSVSRRHNEQRSVFTFVTCLLHKDIRLSLTLIHVGRKPLRFVATDAVNVKTRRVGAVFKNNKHRDASASSDVSRTREPSGGARRLTGAASQLEANEKTVRNSVNKD